MVHGTPHHRDGAWEVFAHGAEIGVRGFGATRDLAFEEAAYALTAAVADPFTVRQRNVVDFVCNAPSDTLLLQEWLNAVIREMTARGMLFSRYAVRSHALGLTGRAWGEPLDDERHQTTGTVKGATTTELEVARDSDGNWMAQCVVDV